MLNPHSTEAQSQVGLVLSYPEKWQASWETSESKDDIVSLIRQVDPGLDRFERQIQRDRPVSHVRSARNTVVDFAPRPREEYKFVRVHVG